MQASHADDIRAHRLRREIVATRLANEIVNRGGPTVVVRLADQTGAAPDEIARAFLIARDAFGLGALDAAVDALDTLIPGETQLALYTRIQDTALGASLWLIRDGGLTGDPGLVARRLSTGVRAYREWAAASGSASATEAAFAAAGVPADLARRVAGLERDLFALDVLRVAESAGAPVERAAEAARAVEEAFALSALDKLARDLKPGDYFDGLALDGDGGCSPTRSAGSPSPPRRTVGSRVGSGVGARTWTARAPPSPIS